MAHGFSRAPVRSRFEVASEILRGVKRMGPLLVDVDRLIERQVEWSALIDQHLLSTQRTLQSQITMLQDHFRWVQRALDRSGSALEAIANSQQRREVSDQTRNHLLEAILAKL